MAVQLRLKKAARDSSQLSEEDDSVHKTETLPQQNKSLERSVKWANLQDGAQIYIHILTYEFLQNLKPN